MVDRVFSLRSSAERFEEKSKRLQNLMSKRNEKMYIIQSWLTNVLSKYPENQIPQIQSTLMQLVSNVNTEKEDLSSDDLLKKLDALDKDLPPPVKKEETKNPTFFEKVKKLRDDKEKKIKRSKMFDKWAEETLSKCTAKEILEIVQSKIVSELDIYNQLCEDESVTDEELQQFLNEISENITKKTSDSKLEQFV